jgi:L-seryl-tRNA(Ser) seleniumtransferase
MESQRPPVTREIEPESLYRLIPSLDQLMLQPAFAWLGEQHSRALVVDALRSLLEDMRTEIGGGLHTAGTIKGRLETLAEAVELALRRNLRLSLVPVLNATGVLLHTNLGRAPLSENALAQIVQVAKGYSNLEFDLDTGARGKRDSHAGPLLLGLLASAAGCTAEELTRTHGVLVVNNCAAATFLALNTLAEGGEVIVSRGELVEIGGSFRIPEILRKSGALEREVGTTNRTRITDYEAAITPNTRLLLRVHQSNFKMEGFTARPAMEELVRLAARTGIPLVEDQGTGFLLSPDEFSIPVESSLLESFRQGADLIAASGDKLLGGPQCGLLLGKRTLIEKIRANPLFRAFRVDKLTYAALEATLLDYALGREDNIPLVKMLRIPVESLRRRCQAIAGQMDGMQIEAEVVSVQSVIGGGTTPGTTLNSFAVALRHKFLNASELLSAFRRQSPPLIARIQSDQVLLDLRTVAVDDDPVVLRILRAAAP